MAREAWEFDPVHSSISFWVRHLVVSKVHGQFTRWTGGLQIDEADPANSSVEVTIDAASIDTREPKRDGHLRSPDFLEVERFPQITFRSTRVEKGDGERFRLAGELTIRGVTREVVLEVEDSGRVKDPWGGERAGFTARGSINRRDFGLTWNQALETGGALVGDKVEIAVEVEAVKARAG